MRQIPVLQLGVGGVGQALVEQVLSFNQHIGGRYGFQFSYIGLADSQGALIDDSGMSPALLLQALKTKRTGGSLIDMPAGDRLADWRKLLPSKPSIVVDVTAQDGAEAGLIEAVEGGHHVVLANKKPLCASGSVFQRLVEGGRTRYEATVGAGLPVISTLRLLLDTGDQIHAIEGCFSGTLGFLMTQLEANVAFSDAVHDARGRGWTEPDPRDDLGGVDVARKALILARTSGLQAELSDVEVESLFPPELASVSLDQFLRDLAALNDPYRTRIEAATQANTGLRYVAQVAPGCLKVGLTAVELASPIGSLRGPDNLVVYRTQRYDERPLSIRGPGAGVDVTAAGVVGDMITYGKAWR